MTLGEKIYKLRTEKGISQETMANDLYVSRQAVSKWETDSSVPDLDKIKLLADYFEISIDELVSENVVNNTKEINSEKYDVNKIKRMSLLIINTAIALAIYYVIMVLIYTIFQKPLMEYYYGRNISFTIPTVHLIQIIIRVSIFVVIGFITKNNIKKDTKTISFEIFSLIFLIVGLLIIGYVFSTIIGKKDLSVDYVMLYNLINKDLSFYDSFSLFLLIIGITIVIVTKKINSTKYTLPIDKKEYKTSDFVLSILNGIFLGIPGLIFQIIWLIDAKKDNEYRYKKMLKGYIIGVVSVIIFMILLFFLTLIFN